MAQLSDFPLVIKSIGWKEFGRRIWQQMGEDDLFTWAASLAYSWIFAIFPFLIFLLTLVPLMPARSKDHAGAQIKGALNYLPENAAQPLEQQVDSLLHTTHGGLLSIGLVVSLWAASGGMSMTMTALDRCYDIKIGRTYIRQRFLALLLTMVSTVLIMLVMILLPIASGVMTWFESQGALFKWPIILALDVGRFGVAVLLLMTILALLYHFGPSLERKFHFLTPGSVLSLCIWILLLLTFKLYINSFGAASYSATYGAVAGVAILLLFFYIDAIVLLIGSEVNSEVDFVVLGLPSDSGSEKPHAALKVLTPSEVRLVEQLRKKRHLQADDGTPARSREASERITKAAERIRSANRPAVQSDGQGVAFDKKLQRGLMMSAIATLAGVATWTAFGSVRAARRMREDEERLRAIYPETYSVLTGRN